MVEEPTDLSREMIRLFNEMRGELTSRLDSIDTRLGRIEQERLSLRQRMQSVEQHAAVFVENSATTNQRLDDIVARLERLEAARV